MLLAAAWKRLLLAGSVVAVLWSAVLWVAPSTPSVGPAQPAVRVAISATPLTVAPPGALRAIVQSGKPAPGGGSFDRFAIAAQPVFAPINPRGQVAFYATVLHAAGRDGIFLADAGGITKLAAYGDAVPGGGTLAGFSATPLPALNTQGHVAFTAELAGGRSTEGLFLVTEAGLQVIALAGDDAPGVPSGVLVGFNAPALNDNDEMAFVATVRRERDELDVLYFWNGRRLQRLIAEGERLLRIGGAMDKIGEPALNNSGVVAFPAAIRKGPTLGGIFVAGARELRLLLGAGDRLPNGGMLLRFSERVAIDDADAIAFGAYVAMDAGTREAVLRTGPDGVSVLALEGEPAPGGGRYAGFGPWPTAAPDGNIAFIAALDGGPGPLAVFAGAAGGLRRVAAMGETLPGDIRLGRFALNAVAAVGTGGTFTVTTSGQDGSERSAIYCRCPVMQPGSSQR